MTRAQANLLRAFALWTVYVWGFRIFTILGDDEHGTGFKVVHSALALVSVAFAVATWIVVSRLRRRRQGEHRVTRVEDPRSGEREPSHF
jgi:hypothetical protein